MTSRIRQATPADAQAIADLHKRSRQAAYAHFMPHAYLFGPEIEEEGAIWSEWLAGSQTETLVFETDGWITGFTRFGESYWQPAPSDTAGSVEQLYIDPALLRQGAGSKLLAAAESGLLRRGFESAFLAVYEANLDARQFYDRQGWSFDGTSWSVERGGAGLVQLRYVKTLRPAD